MQRESPENEEAAGRGGGCRARALLFPAFPEALRTGTVPLFCSPEEKIAPHIFSNPHAKPKTWLQMFSVKWKRSKTSEMLVHQRPFSWLVILSVITGFRKVPGGPVSSGHSVAFMVSISGDFCLPWSSRDTELAEEVSASNSAVEGSSTLRKGKPN